MTVTQQPFEATVRRESGVVIIDLAGEINAFAEEAINAAYDEAAGLKAQTIMLNFSKVSYINSTGIALIVGILAETRKNHVKLVTYGLSEHYVEIFHITRLADFMSIAPDESSALATMA